MKPFKNQIYWRNRIFS